MEFMSRDDMIKYLEELNTRLRDINRSSDIIIFGGAAMALVHRAREATLDIDAKYRSSVELRRVIKSISDDYEIDESWLNNDGEHYVTDKMLTNLYLEYSNLRVYTVNADCLLAMKLSSARMDSSDMDDSIFLMNLLDIQSEKQLVDFVEKYIDDDNRAVSTRFFISEAFLQYQSKKEQDTGIK
jgi:hypothetical protein